VIPFACTSRPKEGERGERKKMSGNFENKIGIRRD